MWNAQLSSALLAGDIDVAVTLNPDLLPTLAYETIRIEPLVAIVPDRHQLAGKTDVHLSALAQERLLLFPRELAPRLYDSMLDICRRAGFEPLPSDQSFHTAWDLGLQPGEPGFSFCPRSATESVLHGLATIRLVAPEPSLPTMLVWHPDTRSAGVQRLVTIARELASAEHWLASHAASE